MRKLTIGISLMIFFGAGAAVQSFAPSGGQDTAFLERRISLLEQRFNVLESTVSRLQQPPITTTLPQPVRDREISALQSEVELLKRRMKEVECGVVHLDERTLSAAAKEALKRTGAPQDPCRLFPETPIQLSPRR
jgi:RNase H-fold protein (predicted Holliday junction resolvase)